MRELRFRAWVYYGERLKKPHYSRDYDSLDMFFQDHSENDIDQCIEQYTGVKDKNCKEIYGGDIVKYAWTRCNYIVAYRKYDASFVLENDDREEIICFQYNRQSDYEVIGNIHQDPELLK